MLLIATAEAVFRKRFIDRLLQHGELCLEATTGEQVLNQVRHAHPEVIVMDLYLQDPDGLEVVRQLRAEGYTGIIILMGGQTIESLMPEAFRLGALQVCGRPLDVERVMGALRVARGELDVECEEE